MYHLLKIIYKLITNILTFFQKKLKNQKTENTWGQFIIIDDF